MHYLVIETFRGGDPAPVYQRLRSEGRLMPEGLGYVSSWITDDLARCYQVMEAADPRLLDQWMARWSDLVEFQVVPVLASADVQERLAGAAPAGTTRTRFEGAAPILRVSDMEASVRYYTAVLGFANAEWGSDEFTAVARDAAEIYLCRDEQGLPGTWAWVGVEDVGALYEEYRATGARIRRPPRNYPWALEMHVEDPDGHVLRLGSEPLPDRPFDDWAA